MPPKELRMRSTTLAAAQSTLNEMVNMLGPLQRSLNYQDTGVVGADPLAEKLHGTQGKVLEFVLAPLDIADADHWIDWLEKAAGVPASWLEGTDKQLDIVESLPL